MLRELAPQVLGALVRHHGDFPACEDAVQEALLAAAAQWPVEGVPANPKGWLITVASRRRIEMWRADSARRRRESTAFALTPPDPEPASGVDDTLTLLVLCCHPALTPASQVALTLRAVGGLTTAEIARAFLVPEARPSRTPRSRATTGSTRCAPTCSTWPATTTRPEPATPGPRPPRSASPNAATWRNAPASVHPQGVQRPLAVLSVGGPAA